MYFKIGKKILYRRYEDYGYITDNSLFGYKFLDEPKSLVGERYVSLSGAVMLDALSKVPQSIEDIVQKLSKVFVGVSPLDLRNDSVEFYTELVKGGFLDCGESAEMCMENVAAIRREDCACVSEISGRDTCLEMIKRGDHIRSVHVEIANVCNERCVHCYIPHGDKTKTIDSTLFLRIIDEARLLNALNITISGGEPLLHKDFILFLRRCRELDLSVNVLSNLVLLSDQIVQEMCANPLLSVQTSLYSIDSSVHDSITKVPGSFDKTSKAIERLVAAGVPVQISCPIMKQNKDTYHEVIKWGREHNVATVTDYVIFASYDHKNKNLANRLTLPEISEAFDKQASPAYVQSLREAAAEKCLQCGQDPICSIWRYYLCVSATGTVFPCVGWQDRVVGDLNTTSLREVWKTAKDALYLKHIKRADFPKCVNCKDRGFCTVCMMANANENSDGDIFRINDFKCRVAALIHKKVDSYEKSNCDR